MWHTQEVLSVRPITLYGVCSDGPEASCQEVRRPQSQGQVEGDRRGQR